MMADVPHAGCDKREQNTNNPLMFSGDFKRENRVLSTANGLLGKSKVQIILGKSPPNSWRFCEPDQFPSI
ncbi:hypothetical protein RRG08_061687 [Elysia crispata]|uniref:Uncharacterized protein n=1 Tax=Elysia crispata TaxID=231223 RepID=A0AAE0XP21_9GAST|nr:hypothetical protein RRG08_061687 [Elysia crispata]